MLFLAFPGASDSVSSATAGGDVRSGSADGDDANAVLDGNRSAAATMRAALRMFHYSTNSILLFPDVKTQA